MTKRNPTAPCAAEWGERHVTTGSVTDDSQNITGTKITDDRDAQSRLLCNCVREIIGPQRSATKKKTNGRLNYR
jgi:hypothetical protein